MLYLNQAYELLTGGYYIGNSSWNKKHTEIDNCFKLYQLVGGEVFVSDGTQTFRLQKGRLYFINGNKLATQYCDYSFSTHWLHFMPKDLMVHQGLLSLPAVVELPADRVGLPEVMPRLQALLDSSVSSGWEYALGCLEVQTLLQTATLRLFDLHPAGLQPVSFAMKKIEPAMRYMNQHFREPIKLEQLAGRCCISPNYFHKVFRGALNMTPANYLTLLRMNAALQLLADKEVSIKNIASELGFADDAHFCRTFKKHYGIAPGEYQKKKGGIFL